MMPAATAALATTTASPQLDTVPPLNQNALESLNAKPYQPRAYALSQKEAWSSPTMKKTSSEPSLEASSLEITPQCYASHSHLAYTERSISDILANSSDISFASSQQLVAAANSKRLAGDGLGVINWNIAAINRNPWEYYVDYKADPRYVQLMENIEHFIERPTEANDVVISSIFTEVMFQQLLTTMQGVAVFADGIEYIKAEWADSFKSRKIISGFMTDKELGDKRFISMPDRLTNCIDTITGLICRPTVTNNYDTKLPDLATWWPLWMKFIFEDEVKTSFEKPATKVYKRFKKLNPEKYPAVTAEESKHSLVLQVLCMAIYDCILVHMMNKLGPGYWPEIKQVLYDELSEKKPKRCLDILMSYSVANVSVILLQECNGNFLEAVRQHSIYNNYHLIVSECFDTVRNQNSIALLSKKHFQAEVKECGQSAQSDELVKGKLADGDLLLFTAKSLAGDNFMFGSFHGDTGGLATIPTLDVIKKIHAQPQYTGFKLIVGMDANAYSHAKPKKQLAAQSLQDKFKSHKLQCNWPDDVKQWPMTTMNARTFLQPQLNKAIRRSEMPSKEMILRDKGNKVGSISQHIDCNPKDFIIFDPIDFCVTHTYVRLLHVLCRCICPDPILRRACPSTCCSAHFGGELHSTQPCPLAAQMGCTIRPTSFS